MKKYDLPFKALNILSDGNFHSGEKIAAEIGCSRVTVWKSITELKTLGINIFSVKKKGYRLPKKISFFNALNALTSRADDHDWVLVHDAARPCARREDIAKLILAAEKHDMAAILGVPVYDTMKRVDPNECIQSTVSRDQLWHAYTPQMARLGILRDALMRASAAEVIVTDEASALEAMGVPVQMVEGHSDNLKVTRPSDLALASFYLNQQSS